MHSSLKEVKKHLSSVQTGELQSQGPNPNGKKHAGETENQVQEPELRPGFGTREN